MRSEILLPRVCDCSTAAVVVPWLRVPCLSKRCALNFYFYFYFLFMWSYEKIGMKTGLWVRHEETTDYIAKSLRPKSAQFWQRMQRRSVRAKREKVCWNLRLTFICCPSWVLLMQCCLLRLAGGIEVWWTIKWTLKRRRSAKCHSSTNLLNYKIDLRNVQDMPSACNYERWFRWRHWPKSHYA